MPWQENVVDSGMLPDWLIRKGIRGLIGRRLRDETERFQGGERIVSLVDQLKASPIALHTEDANQQHYEVPAGLFQLMLGPRRKYSCCYWPEGVETLEDAEIASLDAVAERAQIANGMSILDLGCGWGSLSLYLAERFPRSQITGVSNSHSQREVIEAKAGAKGLVNLRIVTADMNHFDPGQQFDRVVSIEMFEHMRNYKELMRRISTWLTPGGLLFVHIFTHRQFAYTFEPGDWMADHFFTGGIMPSDGLLANFQDDLQLHNHWTWDGTHYQRTLETWLKKLDANRDAARELFTQTYGTTEAKAWLARWRVFLMASAELWGYRQGQEWMVSHYLFGHR